MNSTKILAQDLTLIDQDIKPFWTEYTKEMSQKLSSYTGTDYVDLPSSLWSGSLKKLAQNSWFTVQVKQFLQTNEEKKSENNNNQNYKKIYSQSSKFLWQEITEGVVQKTEEEDSKAMEQAIMKQKEAEERERRRLIKLEKQIELESKMSYQEKKALKEKRETRETSQTGETKKRSKMDC